MNDFTASSRDKLLADLRSVVAEAESLLQSGGGDGDTARGLRERLQAQLTQAKEQLQDFGNATGERVAAASRAADDFVHERPWQAIALGAGLGVIVGLLIGRR